MQNDEQFDRREFLKLTGAGMALCAAGCAHIHLPGKPRDGARVISGKIPESIPGTLPMQWADESMIREAASIHPFDLQARMKFAINAMSNCVDPNLGYISYSKISYDTRPSSMIHIVGDFVDDMGRHTDAQWMIRSANGGSQNTEIIEKMALNAMDVVDDGVAWDPNEKPFLWWTETSDSLKGRWAHLPEGSRVILGLVSYYRATGDKRALRTAKSMVDRLCLLAERKDKYLWLPDYNYVQVGREIVPMRAYRGEKFDAKDPRTGTGEATETFVKDGGAGNFPAAFNGLLLLPVIRYYGETQDERGAEFAIGFSRLIVEMMPNFAKNIGHTHSSLATASGIFHTGLLCNIPEFRQWAEEVYKSFVARDFIPDFAWTPENITTPRVKNSLGCETCTTTDFLELAVQLAMHQDEKYWDDVERITMNQLMEGQMLRLDFIDRIPQGFMKPLPQMDPRWITTDHVPERSLGNFGIKCGPNDWVQTQQMIGSVQCCYGSGARGLYDTWFFTATEQDGTVRVNMQYSKRLPSAVITSWMPAKPVLEVEMTKTARLMIRKPAWAEAHKTTITRDGQSIQPPLEKTYFDFGPLAAGAKVRVEFPDAIERRSEKIGEVTFQTVWRGNAVVEISPAGEIYPLYQNRDRAAAALPLSHTTKNPINPF